MELVGKGMSGRSPAPTAENDVETAFRMIGVAVELLHRAGASPDAADHLIDALRAIEEEREAVVFIEDRPGPRE